MKYCIGADMGGTTTKLGLFSEDGVPVEKWQIPTRIETGMETMLQDIANAVTDCLKRHNISYEDTLGMGIGVAGPVERNGYTERCVNLNLEHFNPNDLLPPLLGGIPVFTANDANLAALGEMWQGGGHGYTNLVFVTLGTGVGGAVILDGNIIYGAKGLAGEIGHIVVNPQEELICNCGCRGCLDQMASATGIVRNAKRLLSKDGRSSVLRGKEPFTAKDVFDGAKAGDPIAAETLDYCLHFLGKCLSDVGYVVDPEIFVIGGGLSHAGQYLIDVVEKHYKKYPLLKKATATFGLATLGGEAGMYGGAKLVLQNIVNS